MIRHGFESPLKPCLALAEDLIPRHTQKNVVISDCELFATSSHELRATCLTRTGLTRNCVSRSCKVPGSFKATAQVCKLSPASPRKGTGIIAKLTSVQKDYQKLRPCDLQRAPSRAGRSCSPIVWRHLGSRNPRKHRKGAAA